MENQTAKARNPDSYANVLANADARQFTANELIEIAKRREFRLPFDLVRSPSCVVFLPLLPCHLSQSRQGFAMLVARSQIAIT